MKRLWFILALCAVVAGTVSADTYEGKAEVKLYTNSSDDTGFTAPPGGELAASIEDDVSDWLSVYGYNPVGPYAAETRNQGGYAQSFQTFCLEYTETFETDHAYYVEISDRAKAGGNDDSESPDLYGDPISRGTAFLYYQFATGGLDDLYSGSNPGYNYTVGTGRINAAWNLQNAIWYLEDEEDEHGYSVGSISSTLMDILTDELGSSESDWKAANAGAYPVRVMNLFNSGSAFQDTLVLVPVPGAVLLGFLGLGAAGLKLRKCA